MLGKDVERMIAGIESVKDAATSAVDSLSGATAYQLTTDIAHREIPVPVGASSFVSGLSSGMAGMSGDCGKMNSLGSSLYTSPNTFNNCCGSPWSELTKLGTAVSAAESFAGAHSTLQWLGEKAALLGLINKVLSASIDARWALMHFHDHIQRGFDHKYNSDIPSYTWAGANGNQTIGNVNHDYKDNVHIPKAPTNVF